MNISQPGANSAIQTRFNRIATDMALLSWICNRVGNRGNSEDLNQKVTEIENDFENYCSLNALNVSFRFDNSLSLLSLVYSILIDLNELPKVFDTTTRKKLAKDFGKEFGGYKEQKTKFGLDVQLMQGADEDKPDLRGAITIIRHLRNSLAHGRYEETELLGVIKFRDQDNDGPTAEFTMNYMQVLDFAYQAAKTFLSIAQRHGVYAQ